MANWIRNTSLRVPGGAVYVVVEVSYGELCFFVTESKSKSTEAGKRPTSEIHTGKAIAHGEDGYGRTVSAHKYF